MSRKTTTAALTATILAAGAAAALAAGTSARLLSLQRLAAAQADGHCRALLCRCKQRAQIDTLDRKSVV